ncbi:MAG: cytochrome-c peroxidase [Myxococcaceae bacterium]|nr:cytochrome-c peroxidase [Myxococcaceae bacterium]
MKTTTWTHLVVLAALGASALAAEPALPPPPLGLPPVPVPADNPQTPEKIALGKKLFEDKRFSSTGKIACANCHVTEKAFTDGPLKTSKGINDLTGTRNAPTVVNAAYFTAQFWDGRSPSLEDQALHPFVNPVEMGLKDHQPILALVRTDPEYQPAFEQVFGKKGDAITMKEVTQAIASFERTQIAGNSPFDRFYFSGEEKALNAAQQRGLALFIGKGRCVSCHVIEQTTALFTDHRFHNVGIGITEIQADAPALATEFLKTRATLAEVDVKVLSDKRTSELGRLVVTRTFDDIGSFKTPTLRNAALTAPYMHDGSLKTLREVMVHYNNGGVTKKGAKVNDFLSGGILPLELTDKELDDLVAFMDALTSPELAKAGKAGKKGEVKP